MGMFVVSIVLVLPCDNDGCPGCLPELLQSHMELEQVLGILDGSRELNVMASQCMYVMQAGNAQLLLAVINTID